MYATVARMVQRFGEQELIELTDTQAPYTRQIHVGRLQMAMDAANSEVDGYLSTRYAVPIADAPLFVVSLACDLARYHAVVAGARVTERDEARYKAAIRSLESIAKGTLSIGTTPQGGDSSAASSADVVMVSGRQSVFGQGGW